MNELQAHVLFNLNVKAAQAWRREEAHIIGQLDQKELAPSLLPLLTRVCEAVFILGYGARVEDEGKAGIIPVDLFISDMSGPTV